MQLSGACISPNRAALQRQCVDHAQQVQNRLRLCNALVLHLMCMVYKAYSEQKKAKAAEDV